METGRERKSGEEGTDPDEDLAMSVYAARSTPGQFISINQEIAFFAWGILSGFSALLIPKSCE